jgi:hexulose-6-phosphate isomerase
MLNYIENSLISENSKHRKTSLEIILNTIDICTDIGASLVLVPFFGTASIITKKQIQILTMEMQKLANPAEEKGVHLGLETGLEASTMVQLVESIGSDHVGVYFDTGNTASKGYNMKHEISTLSENILQVHIKDYPYRKLGEGNINFHDVISSLKKISFDGYLILETPSLDDSSKTAIENLEFLKQTLAGVD